MVHKKSTQESPQNGFQQLRDSETRYRRLFETARDGMLIVDGQTGLIIDANPYLFNILDISREDLVGRTLWDLPVFYNSSKLQALFAQILEKGNLRLESLPLTTTKGLTFLFDVVCNLYEEDQQKLIQFQIRDATRHRAIEENLQREHNLAQAVLDVAGVLIFIIGLDHTVTMINRKGCEMLGCTEEEILGQDWIDNFIPERFRADLHQYLEQIFHEKTIGFMETHENPILLQDGSERLISWNNYLLRDENGAVTGMLSSGEDITEKRQIEQDLNQALLLLEAVTTEANAFIGVMDTDYRYIYFNQNYADEFCRMTGREINIGQTIFELYKDRPELLSVSLPLWQAAMGGEKTERLIKYGDPSYYQRTYRSTLTPIRDRNGKIIAAGVISLDFTHQSQDEAVNTARLELRNYAMDHTAGETMRKALESAQDLTSSQFGLFYVPGSALYKAEQVWSRHGAGSKPMPPGVKEEDMLGHIGLWEECLREARPIIHNDFNRVPVPVVSQGGHGLVTRDMMVPVVRNGVVVAVLGLANKKSNFEEDDIRIATEIAETTWDLVVYQRAQQQTRYMARFPEENPNVAIRTDREGKLLYGNPSSQQLLKLWGCEIGQFIPERYRKIVGEVHRTSKPRTIQIPCEDKIYSVMFVPVAEFEDVTLYGLDVTELIQTMNALEEVQAELESRVQVRTRELEEVNNQLRREGAIRTQAEEALQAAYAYNRSLIEASPDPLVTITADGKVGDVNAATELATGYVREDLIGTDFHDYFTDPEKARAGYRQVFKDGFVRDYELEIRHRDGHLTPVLYNASVYRDKTGAVGGVFAAARDITRIRKAEQELREKEALLRGVLENLPVGVWISDRNGHIIHGNPAGRRIWANSRHHAVDEIGQFKGWWAGSGKPIKAEDWASYRAIHHGEVTINDEVEIECFDGTHKILLNSAIPLWDGGQNVMGVIIVNQEITEIKKVQKDLQDAYEVLEKAFASVDLLMVYLDRDFNILRANRAYAEANFHEPDYFFGRNFFEFFPRGENEAIFQKVMKTGEPFVAYEMPFKMVQTPEQGVSYFDWSLQPVKDVSGKTQGLVFSLADVTRRKEAELALEADRQRLLMVSQAERVQRLFAESLTESLLALNTSLDINGVLEHILDQIRNAIPFDGATVAFLENGNVRTVQQRGLEGNPQLLMTLSKGIPLEELPLWQELMSQTEAVWVPNREAGLGLVPTPGFEWVQSYLGVTLRHGDTVIGFINLLAEQPDYFSEESTRRLQAFASQAAIAIQNARLFRELENSLAHEQEMRSQLVNTEKFAAMGRMLASVAHELNNPLQTIHNCLYLTRMDLPADSPNQEFMVMAFSEIERLSKIVAQLRELYRPRPPMTRRINLVHTLAEARVLMAPHFQTHLVTWEQQPGAEDLPVECDPDQIKQVFINLGMNAVDAMQANGGKLYVSARRSEDGANAVFTFRDTGSGIPEDILPNLFEPFFTTKNEGLGLGLAICYELVHRFNGQISVESNLNEGTTFTVVFPLMEGSGEPEVVGPGL